MGGELNPGGDGPASGSGGSSTGGGGGDGPIVPFCDSTNYPPVAFAPAAGLGVTAGWESHAIQVYASRPEQHIVAVSRDQATDRGAFGNWMCFDTVPRPSRVSATNLVSSLTEVFVSTGDGGLYRRTERYSGWTGWSVVNRPRQDSRITDVHVAGGIRTRVYVADSGYVFGRYRATNEAVAEYEEWRVLGNPKAERVTAAITSTGAELVLVVDWGGSVFSSVDPDPESDWQVVPTDGDVLDLDIGYTPDGGMPILYVLERDGGLKRATRMSEDVWSDWEWLKEPGPPHLQSITVFHDLNDDLIFGIDTEGRVWELRRNFWVEIPGAAAPG